VACKAHLQCKHQIWTGWWYMENCETLSVCLSASKPYSHGTRFPCGDRVNLFHRCTCNSNPARTGIPVIASPFLLTFITYPKLTFIVPLACKITGAQHKSIFSLYILYILYKQLHQLILPTQTLKSSPDLTVYQNFNYKIDVILNVIPIHQRIPQKSVFNTKHKYFLSIRSANKTISEASCDEGS